jgi:hypothetical protein
LAERHITLSASSSVAEIGPGLLLPMLRLRRQCECTAYGLLLDSWRQDLAGLGIATFEWDANEPLFSSLHCRQHDLVLFCEVIEHLNRWPIEVLRDVYDLLAPGGKLILTTVNFVRGTNRLRMLVGKSPLINPFERNPDGTNHIREYTVQELEQYLGKAGFFNLHSRYWSLYPPGIAGTMASLCGALVPSTSSHIVVVAEKPTGI